MKLLFSVIAFLGVCASAYAQRMDEAVVRFSNVTTGATASVQTSDLLYNGYVERVSAVFTTNHTINIRVSAHNEYSGLSQTIYENTNGVGTNFTAYPRILADDTSGDVIDSEYVRIPLVKDNIKYEVWGASATNQTVLLLFYYNGM